jgi:hypothetical protein
MKAPVAAGAYTGHIDTLTHMKIKITCPQPSAGRVLVGPAKVRAGYCRIVSERGGSGRIERFDPASGSWSAAPDHVTFNEVWNAPIIAPVAWTSIVEKLALKRRSS